MQRSIGDIRREWDVLCMGVQQSLGHDTKKYEDDLMKLTNPNYQHEMAERMTLKYLEKIEKCGMTVEDALDLIKANASKQGKLH